MNLRELKEAKASEVGFLPAFTEWRGEHAITQLILHSTKAHGSKYVCFNLVWFVFFFFKCSVLNLICDRVCDRACSPYDDDRFEVPYLCKLELS